MEVISISLLPLPDNLIPLLIAGIIAIVVIAVAVVLLKKRQVKSSGTEPVTEISAMPAAGPVPVRLRRPEAAAGPPVSVPAGVPVSAAEARVPAEREAVDLLGGRADITASLQALAKKYSLDQFTLATRDGLVFASSGSATAQDDAAIFGGRFARDPAARAPGVQLFGLVHRGSGLVGIIRAKRPVEDRVLSEITADTKDILNWWI